MNSIKIGKDKIGDGEIFFTIEEGQYNQGNLDKALKMMDYAKNIGANAIEFQFAIAKDFYIKNHSGYDVYSKIQFNSNQIKEILEKAEEVDLNVISVPFSSKLIDLLIESDCSAFNINASDLTNPEILDAVADSGLPFFLSLPLATEEEIDWAVQRIYKKEVDEFVLLHGQHIMASSNESLNIKNTSLGYIKTLKEKYDLHVGYIDHTPFKWMPACAVAAGADVITKHLTLNLREKGPDWQICLEPDDMGESITITRQMYNSINNTRKNLTSEEMKDRSIMRRSIVTSKNIFAGQKITFEDISFKRPGDGIDPSEYEKIIGKIARYNIPSDQLIKYSDLEEE